MLLTVLKTLRTLGFKMKRDTSTKRRWRFRGIIADAAALGVHRTHLYKVLSGVRTGKSLLQRYEALKRLQGADPASASEFQSPRATGGRKTTTPTKG